MTSCGLGESPRFFKTLSEVVSRVTAVKGNMGGTSTVLFAISICIAVLGRDEVFGDCCLDPFSLTVFDHTHTQQNFETELTAGVLK